MKKKVIFILGPTAVGKTYFSVLLAKKFGGEIISADSVQVFKGLDIGSAKVTKDEMDGVVHYAIDILEPEQDFSVFEYVEYTKKKIDEIISHGKIPIIVGGTALYVKSLTLGYNFGGVEKNFELREKLSAMENDEIFEILRKKDAEMAEKIDRFNHVRLVRAVEIALSSGERKQSAVDIEPLLIALTKDRETLYNAINLRVDKMIDAGLIEEVEGLKKRGLTRENSSMKAIGYKEVLDYLDGKCSRERMIELIKQHSRNYAKRQFTFLRSMDGINFVDVQDLHTAKQQIFELVGDFLNEKP